jgi:hypothetical protein
VFSDKLLHGCSCVLRFRPWRGAARSPPSACATHSAALPDQARGHPTVPQTRVVPPSWAACLGVVEQAPPLDGRRPLCSGRVGPRLGPAPAGLADRAPAGVPPLHMNSSSPYGHGYDLLQHDYAIYSSATASLNLLILRFNSILVRSSCISFVSSRSIQ